MKRAPALATWLLEHLLSRPSLTGDIIEEYARGRSRAWYWRQVCVAILVGAFIDVRAHKWLAVRAVLIGYVVLRAERRVIYNAVDVARPWVGDLGPYPGQGVGWTVTALVLVTTGWIVGRFHRPYQAGMVLLFCQFLWLIQLPWLLTLVMNTLGHPRYQSYLADYVITLILQGFYLSLGGLLSAGNLRGKRVLA
jgi:hypothetical protein